MKINKGVIIQKIGKKVTIFDGEKSALYTLNETATFLFLRIKDNVKSEKIIEDLAQKYKISVGVAKKDVEEFIESLKKKKIIFQ